MRKLFTILAIATVALTLSSCEKVLDLFDQKVEIEGSQWEAVNETLPPNDWGKLIAVYDIGYTKPGNIYNFAAVVESSKEDTPVGSTLILNDAEYEISYDKDGNPTTITIKESEGINIDFTIKVIDKDYITFSIDDTEVKLRRIANPYKLDLSSLDKEK